jgi:hypothetical protein
MSDASDVRAGLDRPVRRDLDYIHQDHPDRRVRDYIRQDQEVHPDLASAADPDAPDRYKSDGLEPDSPVVSACRDAAGEALREPVDECSISPPYLDAEAPPASPVVDPLSSVLRADAAVGREPTARWASRAGLFAAAAMECWAGSALPAGAHLARA